MPALLLSLFAGILSQETAEDAFKKVEAALESARSIRAQFTIGALNEQALPSKGFLHIEAGGKAKLECTLRSADGASVAFSEECDGRRIISTFGNRQVQAPYDPKNGRRNYTIYLSRVGVLLGVACMHGFYGKARQPEATYSLDLTQFFQVRNVQFGERHKGMAGLTFELKSAIEPFPIDVVKIWYDPGTYKLTRREYRIRRGDLDETIIEEYSDVQFDEVKPAEPKDQPPPAPISDAEMENLFFKAKLTVAESHLKAGRKAQAAEILEEIIKTYPKHSAIPDARRLLVEAKK